MKKYFYTYKAYVKDNKAEVYLWVDGCVVFGIESEKDYTINELLKAATENTVNIVRENNCETEFNNVIITNIMPVEMVMGKENEHERKCRDAAAELKAALKRLEARWKTYHMSCVDTYSTGVYECFNNCKSELERILNILDK